MLKQVQHDSIKKVAFTLAEVLITLTIIGVIAALTIPNLITSYQKHVVETKVVKFYSMMNNALKLSTIDNGPIEDWIDGSHNYNTNELKKFNSTYILPYIKYSKIIDNCATNWLGYTIQCTILPDGSYFRISGVYEGGQTSIVYHVNGKKEASTRNHFAFQLNQPKTSGSAYTPIKNYIEPYHNEWNGSLSQLKSGHRYSCNKSSSSPDFCTKLLQLNNWKITKDYPW